MLRTSLIKERKEWKKEGRKEGILEGKKEIIIRTFRRNLGFVPSNVEAKLNDITDLTLLDEIIDALLEQKEMSEIMKLLG